MITFKSNGTLIARNLKKHIGQIEKKIEKATINALNDTAKTVQTRGVREVAERTGYKAGRLKSRVRIQKAAPGRLNSIVFFDSMKPLNVTALKGTRALSRGYISYKFLNKRQKRKGFIVNINGQTLAVRNVLTGQASPKFKRSARGKVKVSKSGLRYTSGRISALTGPSVPNVFRDPEFYKAIEDVINQTYSKRFTFYITRPQRYKGKK